MIGVKLFLVLLINFYQANTEESENNNVYGKDWVVFLDDKGNPYNVNLNMSVEAEFRKELTHSKNATCQPSFWLYTRETIDNPEKVVIAVNKTNYLHNAPLLILVHGWLNNRDSASVQYTKNAILEHKKVNVIIMDWSCMITDNYIVSAKRTASASEKLKDFVQSLANIYLIHGSKIHLIGHSLGAHVVGLAGEKLRKNNLLLSRVTGLDPAKPYFELPPKFPGITKDAAAFVDIIHTSIGVLGIVNAVGHADFYPGGGLYQPSLCPSSILPGFCEHRAAYIYFEKSLTNEFKAYKCHDYFLYKLKLCNENEVQNMGDPCEPTARGSYFLNIMTIDK